MQVNQIQSNRFNSPNFGMALHIKDAKVFRKVLGNNIAEMIESAKPELEELAKDVDIFIKPRRFADNPFFKPDQIGIYVQEKNITLKDRIMRLFNQRPPYKTDTWIDPEFSFTKESLVKETANRKKILNWISKECV